jgi:hypothetical protein
MKPIQPIHPKARGAAVANLHEALVCVVQNQPGISDKDRGTLERGLASAHLVSLFQQQLAERFQLFVNSSV